MSVASLGSGACAAYNTTLAPFSENAIRGVHGCGQEYLVDATVRATNYFADYLSSAHAGDSVCSDFATLCAPAGAGGFDCSRLTRTCMDPLPLAPVGPQRIMLPDVALFAQFFALRTTASLGSVTIAQCGAGACADPAIRAAALRLATFDTYVYQSVVFIALTMMAQCAGCAAVKAALAGAIHDRLCHDFVPAALRFSIVGGVFFAVAIAVLHVLRWAIRHSPESIGAGDQYHEVGATAINAEPVPTLTRWVGAGAGAAGGSYNAVATSELEIPVALRQGYDVDAAAAPPTVDTKSMMSEWARAK